MADEKQERGNAFLPDFNGPLSDVLRTTREPQPLQVPNPTAKVSKMAGAAAITDQLLAGIEKGRLRKFQNEQNARKQKYEAIYRTYAQISSDPRLTDAAKAQAAQEFRMALGGMIDKETSPADGKKGKGKDQPPVLGIIKQFAQGLTGGKMQGQPDIDVGTTIAKMSSVYDKSGQPLEQFSTQGQQAKLTQEVQDAMQGANSETEARAAISKFLPKIQALYGWGPEAQRFIENTVRGLPALSPEQESATKRLNANGPPMGQGGNGKRTPPGLITPVPNDKPPMGGGQQQAVSAAGSQMKQRSMDWEQVNSRVYEISKNPIEVSYQGKDGKEQRAQALYVSNPDFSGYVNATTWEPLPSTAVDATKTSQIDDREKKLNELVRANDEKILNFESEIRNREAGVGLREQGLQIKAADLARKQDEYDRTMAFRQQLADQQKKIQGIKLWTPVYTNMINRTSKIASEAASRTQKLDVAGLSKDAKAAAMQDIDKWKKDQINQVQGGFSQELSKIYKQTGLEFGTDGNPKEEGEAQSAAPKAAAPAKNDKQLEKRGQEISDFLNSKTQ